MCAGARRHRAVAGVWPRAHHRGTPLFSLPPPPFVWWTRLPIAAAKKRGARAPTATAAHRRGGKSNRRARARCGARHPARPPLSRPPSRSHAIERTRLGRPDGGGATCARGAPARPTPPRLHVSQRARRVRRGRAPPSLTLRCAPVPFPPPTPSRRPSRDFFPTINHHPLFSQQPPTFFQQHTAMRSLLAVAVLALATPSLAGVLTDWTEGIATQ